jgi:hypothetical protein
MKRNSDKIKLAISRTEQLAIVVEALRVFPNAQVV